MKRRLHTASIVFLVISCVVTLAGMLWMLWAPIVEPDTSRVIEGMSTAYTGLIFGGLSYWLFCATED